MGSSQNIGTIFALITFISWGVFPIYWKLLNRIDPIELTCHRGIWTFLAALSIALNYQKGAFALGIFKGQKDASLLFDTGHFARVQLVLFVSAVQNERVLEVSFGYYINPIMSVLIGIFYFKEQTSRWEKVAIAIALAAILYIGIGYGEMPWYAILLASSFALYGAIKKKQPAVNFASLSLEFFFIMLGGLPYLIYLLWVGENTFFKAM